MASALFFSFFFCLSLPQLGPLALMWTSLTAILPSLHEWKPAYETDRCTNELVAQQWTISAASSMMH